MVLWVYRQIYLQRIILDQGEDHRWPKLYIQRTAQKILDNLSACLTLLILLK